MAKNNTETEVKIKVGDLGAIVAKLQVAGAALKSPRVYERNVRYDDANESLTPAKHVLRLRQDTEVRLTYKEPQGEQNNRESVRTELEVSVSDFETMELILGKLGFHTAWIYEKYRTTYEINDCEVVLDEMPFGAFIEVEGDSDGIEKTLTALGLADAARIIVSYSALFFRAKERLQLSFRDLTFDNFKGISVQDAAFE